MCGICVYTFQCALDEAAGCDGESFHLQYTISQFSRLSAYIHAYTLSEFSSKIDVSRRETFQKESSLIFLGIGQQTSGPNEPRWSLIAGLSVGCCIITASTCVN